MNASRVSNASHATVTQALLIPTDPTWNRTDS